MKAVNLIPSEQRSGASVGAGRSEGAAYAVIALIAGVAVLALFYGKARHEISSSSGQAAALNEKAQQATAKTNELAPYTSFVGLREQRMQAVAQLVNSRFDWAHVFHEFGRVLPPETSISSISGTVGSVGEKASSSAKPGASASASVASATPPGSVPTFTLTGCATSQAAVALALERLRLMDGVSNVSLQSSTAAFTPGASSSAGASTGGCLASDPTFNVTISFEALPQSAASAPVSVDASTSAGGAR
jgi:Tfp pilus assembly protein PilN